MLRDLSITPPDAPIDADLLVVGAGMAGLPLATAVASDGLRVVVLESGAMIQKSETHPLNEVVQLGAVYAGAEHGRFRCLGGTSSRWGGAMIPFLAADLQGSRGADYHWPVGHGDLLAFLPQVEALFDLAPGPYEQPGLIQSRNGRNLDFIPRLAKWPSFAKRNVATLLDRDVRSGTGPEIWLNATATKFDLRPDGNLGAICATGPGGEHIEVHARETVIAAGAIESTRLLLLADRQNGGRLFTPDDILGRYFYDHLSVEVAEIKPSNRKELNRVAGYRFQGKGMRNLRFEPIESPDVRADVPPGFAHIAFATDQRAGFDVLRDVYRSLQRRDRISWQQLCALAAAAPWIVRAAWWRFYEHRLLYPANANVNVHMVIEQTPRASNRIGLSPERQDRYGLPLATIEWHVNHEDHTALDHATDRFVALWRGSNLSELGKLVEHERATIHRRLDEGGGVYHPGGSTRMGTSPRNAVVDANLRAFRVPNLRVVSTSCFPSGGGANPTMMLMMAALRAADDIRRSLGAEPQ